MYVGVKIILFVHWPLEEMVVILKVWSPNTWGIKFMNTSCEIALRWMSQKTLREVNIGSDNGLVPSGIKSSAPSHYLDQYCNVVNWTLGNKLKCNCNRNLYIFIHSNAFEIVVCEITAILSRPQCVKKLCHFSSLLLQIIPVILSDSTNQRIMAFTWG